MLRQTFPVIFKIEVYKLNYLRASRKNDLKFMFTFKGIGPSYVNDITIPRLKGTMGGLFGISLTFGITFGNFFGLTQVLYVYWLVSN